MMEKLHGHSNGIVWKIIMGVVTVSFVLSGVGGYLISRQNTSAASVNGTEISQRSFLQEYQQQYQQLASQMGAQFANVADSPEFITGLRQSVINRMIDQELLRQYATELKLGVSDEQIKVAIVSSPIFQVDGKFSNERYQRLLQGNRIQPDQYAGLVRQDLITNQLNSSLLLSDFITPKQIDELVKLLYQKRSVRLATLPLTEALAQQSVSQQEIENYYNSHRSAFAVPELVKVQYIDLNEKDIAKNIQVTDVEAAQYYQDNQSQYLGSSEQHLAHIQVNNLDEADKLYQQLKSGANFAELAKKYSIDSPSAVNGGDLSWVVPGEMPKAFEQAADKTAVGEYSEPVKVGDSYHIIEVLDRHQGKILPFDQVKEQIIKTIRQERGLEAFFKVQKAVADKAFEDQSSLEAAAKVADLSVQETGYFSQNDVPSSLNYPNLINQIFSSDLIQGGENSTTITVGENHSIVVRVVDHKEATTQTLEQVKTQIEKLLQHEKAVKVEQEKAMELVKKLETGDQTAVNFNQTLQVIYAQGNDPALDQTIFAMPLPKNGKPSYAIAQNAQGEVVIIALDKVVDGTIGVQQQQELVSQLQLLKAQDLQETLLKVLREQAKIEINQSFINQNQ
ncbi:peptidylprolyl isomerase [Mergibacter septicus]|uniref:peptidylprolyl isomerase n=1 Tax=Mergibacter septicus TaxID=221402 RepID=UPI001C7447A5|nr:peptidylprolyl isomerase [Mergibacter septicus]QDJ12813.1 peptidylprolyl isomerase [Mergibacter septicus]